MTDKYVRNISLVISGFKPRISGVGRDHSANCATTTAKNILVALIFEKVWNCFLHQKTENLILSEVPFQRKLCRNFFNDQQKNLFRAILSRLLLLLLFFFKPVETNKTIFTGCVQSKLFLAPFYSRYCFFPGLFTTD